MFSIFRRRSSFARALEAKGLAGCSMSGTDLWIGLPPHPDYKRVPIAAVPEAPTSVLFAEGPEQAELVAALVAGPEAKTLERLMIGTSHDYIGRERPTPYDFSATIAALKGAELPSLKWLSLGDMELLFNGHGYYGHLGDITHVFDVAPNLDELRICGRPEITRPVRHETLQTLLVEVDDIAGNSGAMGEAAVTHILSSQFPRLTQLQLSLDADDVPPYRIPEVFFSGEGFPSLEAVSIDCLTPEDEARLKAWKAERKLRW